MLLQGKITGYWAAGQHPDSTPEMMSCCQGGERTHLQLGHQKRDVGAQDCGGKGPLPQNWQRAWVSGRLWLSSVMHGGVSVGHTQEGGTGNSGDGGRDSPTPGHSCPADLVGGGPPTVAAVPHTAKGTSPPGPWP